VAGHSPIEQTHWVALSVRIEFTDVTRDCRVGTVVVAGV